MVRRLFRFGLRVAVLAAVAYVARKVWESRQLANTTGDGWAGSDKSWQPPSPASPQTPPRAAAEPAAAPPAAAPPAAAPSAHAQPPIAPVAAASVAAAAAPSAGPSSALASAPETAKVAKAAGGKRKAPTAKASVPKPDTSSRVWVEPVGSTCPPNHPVKVKLASRLFRVPGMFAYERSRPDRCYPDDQAALAEGFTRAQR